METNNIKSFFTVKYTGVSPNEIKRFFVDRLDKDFDKNKNQNYFLTKTDGLCLFCGKKLYFIGEDSHRYFTGYEWDHLVPASKWGLRTIGNFVPICKDCNQAKSNKSALDFYREQKVNNKFLYKTEEEFLAFLHDFQTPYRENHPKLFEIATTTHEIDDDYIFSQFFYKRDENDELIISLKSRDNKITFNGPNSILFNEVVKEIEERLAPSLIQETRSGLKRIEENMFRKYGTDSTFNELETRKVNDLYYSTIHTVKDSKSASSKSGIRRAFKILADLSKRDDLKTIITKMPNLKKMKDDYWGYN